ncbi:MAG: ribose 5-phosphate isomerase B [Alphaproteobacteria bacterium]|nr:ribose 5-phosphate isomerase B [Alphaproteobacteria bacterium]
MQEKKIIIASDHAGCAGKDMLKQYLKDQGYTVFDYGTHSPEQSVDYPDKAYVVAKGLTRNEAPKAILLCGSGIGMSIAINRYDTMRGALCCTPEMARLARAHNDANVLILGGRLTDDKTLKACVDEFLNTPFDGGRHLIRVKKLGRMPNEL